MILAKRFQQGIFQALEGMNRAASTGTGSGFLPMANGGYAAAGGQGGYSTANSSTWTDISNTSFTIYPTRTGFFFYMIFATAHISAGAGTGYVRGNIVGYDVTASPWYAGGTAQNGYLWYGPYIKGPIQPGTYVVKLQAATDSGATTITIDQFFHQFLYLNG